MFIEIVYEENSAAGRRILAELDLGYTVLEIVEEVGF